MNKEIDLTKLIKWIAANLEVESAFLSPRPSASIEVVSLINKIAELTEMDKEVLGQMLNEHLNNQK